MESKFAHASPELGTEENTSFMQNEVNKLPESIYPIYAVEEWPEPKKFHSFYMVKYRPYSDPKLKVKLDDADKENKMLSQARSYIIENLNEAKLKFADLDEVREEHQVFKGIKQISELKKPKTKAIETLEAELKIVNEERDKAFEKLQDLRRQVDEGNAPYHQNSALLNKARELAAMNDVEALKGFVGAEVNKFMSLWSSNKEFKEDYERRVLPSLDMRQLSRDGRMKNPDEKPLVLMEPNKMVAKSNPKQLKENLSSSEAKCTEETVGQSDLKAGDEISELERLEKEVVEAKLKALKREEEMAKAKQAIERKKKLAEKAAARAAIKAQKEAEKKQKEREKRARKKAAASASASAAPEEACEMSAEVTESKKIAEIVQAKEAKPIPMKRIRAKSPNQIPKIILKRKKSRKNWVWKVAAALLVVMLVYSYLS